MKLLTLLLIYFTLIATGHSQTQAAKRPAEDIVVDGEPYSEWLHEILKWRQDPQNHGAVSNAIVSGARRAEGLLIACFSKAGYSAKNPADAESIENFRGYAMFATEMLRTNAHWLTEGLLEIVQDRGWKGRDFAVCALTYVSPNNAVAYSIALEDLKSSDDETRHQGLLQVRTNLKSPEAISLVIDATNDSSQKTRSWAIYTLGEIAHNPTVAAKLKEISMDASRSEVDRSGAQIAMRFNKLEDR